MLPMSVRVYLQFGFSPKIFPVFLPEFLSEISAKILPKTPREIFRKSSQKIALVMAMGHACPERIVREALIAYRENFWKNPQEVLLQIYREKLLRKTWEALR